VVAGLLDLGRNVWRQPHLQVPAKSVSAPTDIVLLQTVSSGNMSRSHRFDGKTLTQ
jgi:hypothetical protein